MGFEHYETARKVQETLQKYKSLQDIIAILGMDELSRTADRRPCAQDPEVQPPPVAEVFTSIPGEFVRAGAR